MLSQSRTLALLALGTTLLLGGACKSRPDTAPPAAASPVKVDDIDVGRSLAADKSIAEKTDNFRPADTVYVAVKTSGAAPSATLAAHFRFGEQPVSDSTQTIAPRGPEVTEFHVSKPDGWPTGDYQVEILLNGVSAGKESFKVQ
jgi:hypothetical protein